MLNIADCALGPGQEPRDSFVAFGSNSTREFDRHANADLAFPFGVDPRQIVRENEGRPRAICAVDRNDGLIGQRKTWVEISNGLGVPFDNLAEIDVRQDISSQPELSRRDALQVHDRHHAAHDDWKLYEARSGQFFWTERSIGSSEIHRPALDLPDADARTNGLVVDPRPGSGRVGLRPFGQYRIHKRGSSPMDVF